MALQKTLETPTGNSGDYWRVDQIILERTGKKMECRLNLYKSKTDRDGGKRRMDEQQALVFDIPAGSTTLSQLINGIYSNAKTTPTSDQAPTDTPFFQGAIDV